MQFISGDGNFSEEKIAVSRIFVEAFYQWFQYFSKDTEKLALAFENTFVWDRFYFAVCDGKICGITACTDGKSPSIKLIRKDLVKHLGFVKGTIANLVLKNELENHPYPFELSSDTMSIEFVAVDKGFRNKSVATNLIKHIIENNNCSEFILEVADTNESAVNLYKKLGFVEFLSVPHKQPKQSGINNLIYMKYKK